MTKRSEILSTCEVCGKLYHVPPTRLNKTKYCGKACANIGQPRKRVVWAKGKTKHDDPRLASIAAKRRAFYVEHPEHQRGKAHPMYGKHHSEEAREKMREFRKTQPVTDGMRNSLDGGRLYFKGRTKENDPIVARRAAILSKKYAGKANPEQGKRLRAYYLANPEKHPNRILARRGHETDIERIMRVALTDAGIVFEPQYPIGGCFGDFGLPSHKLIIEVDGAYWHAAAKDAIRDVKIAALGWRVIRFSEDRIVKHIDACIAEIRLIIG